MKECLTSDNRMLEYGIMKPYSNISCFSTTRHGGCGEGNYATFNCTHYCGDRPEHVKANLDFVKAYLKNAKANQEGCVEALVIPRQTHTTNVRVITEVPSEEDVAYATLFMATAGTSSSVMGQWAKSIRPNRSIIAARRLRITPKAKNTTPNDTHTTNTIATCQISGT